jgi:predicted NAD-dependent protein-ADP-ribosyltransferase YbiA (DUF1768 family)
MSNTIQLFNPFDKPYGALSNNAIYYMNIDITHDTTKDIKSEKWKTVTNYIYANLLTMPGYRVIVKNRNPNNAKKLSDELQSKTIKNTVMSALEESLEIKFNNPKLKELLVSTGTSPLIYLTDDTMLGINSKGEGANLLGKYLSQIRHRLEVSYTQEKEIQIIDDKNTRIYNTYIAEKALDAAIHDDNDLFEYIKLDIDEIIDKYGRDKIMNKMPTRDIVLTLFRRNNLNEVVMSSINNPKMLVTGVRKRELGKLRTRLIARQKKLVLDMYMNYILQRDYPTLKSDQYHEAREQQLQEIDLQEKLDLQNNLFDLFVTGALPELLSNRVDEMLSDIKLPSEEEVEEAESMPITTVEEEIVTMRPYRPEAGSIIYFSDDNRDNTDPKYSDFAPSRYTEMLSINNYTYPTITHYIFTRLLALFQNLRTIKNAYPYILVKPTSQEWNKPQDFIDPKALIRKYVDMKNAEYVYNLKKYTVVGMDAKFSNRMLQDILLLTENMKIVWNDKEDSVLGVGPKGNGENFMGNYMMELRNKIRKDRHNEPEIQITSEDIVGLLESDIFMKSWFEMRVRDMCKAVYIMKAHVYTQTGEQMQIDSKFTETVLDKIYQPCSELFTRAKHINIPTPQYVKFLVNNCNGFKDCTIIYSETKQEVVRSQNVKGLCPGVVDVIWKRLVVMIYFLIEYRKLSTLQNIRAIIARIENIVSTPSSCEQILDNKWDSCIISAIINLVKGINRFNKAFVYSSVINQNDINTAVSIIVNSLVHKPKEPKEKTIDNIEKVPISRIHEEEDVKISPETAPEFLFPDDDITSENGRYGSDNSDVEYGYGSDEEDGGHRATEDELNVLSIVIHDFEKEDVEDAEELVNMLIEAVQKVKGYKMSNKLKINRVNFFSTTS